MKEAFDAVKRIADMGDDDILVWLDYNLELGCQVNVERRPIKRNWSYRHIFNDKSMIMQDYMTFLLGGPEIQKALMRMGIRVTLHDAYTAGNILKPRYYASYTREQRYSYQDLAYQRPSLVFGNDARADNAAQLVFVPNWRAVDSDFIGYVELTED